MESKKTTFGVYQFKGLPENPWNGMIVYTVTTPEGKVIELLGRFQWSQEQFEGEIQKGLWTSLPTEDYLDFDQEGKVIIQTIERES